MKEKWQLFLEQLPKWLSDEFIRQIDHKMAETICEVRFRTKRPVAIIDQNQTVYYLGTTGKLKTELKECLILSKDEMYSLFNKLSEYSAYAYEKEILKGFLTLPGGNRMGIAGSFLYEEDKLISMVEPNALNIRIAKEHKGIADNIFPKLLKDQKRPYSTLIASLPGYGKTSLLRDLIRLLSTPSTIFQGLNVGLIDERSEIASIYEGVPQNDIGIFTDVYDKIEKRVGMRMMLRSMTPRVLAVDEIGTKEDLAEIKAVFFCGCSVFATTHLEDITDVSKNQFVISCKLLFERLIIITENHKLMLYELPGEKLIFKS